MSEEGKPYIPMNSSAKLMVEDEEGRIEHQKRLDLIELEITKIQTLPAGYWPDEWRKHLGRLSTCGAALLRLMKDEEKAHAFDKRAFEAIDAIERVYQEMEAATFIMTGVSPTMPQDTRSKKEI